MGVSKIKNIDYNFYHWGPYLFKTKMPQYIIDRLLIDGKKTTRNWNHQLAGHLKNQFEYEEKTQSWFCEEMQPMFRAYREGHCKYHAMDNLDVDYAMTSLWINYMKAGDYNPPHTHSDELSFVIFLDIPEELTKEQLEFKGTGAAPGTLEFKYGEQARPQWATTTSIVNPMTGDIYIFPALLQHTVVPYKSDVTRISVSGNLKATNLHTFPARYF